MRNKFYLALLLLITFPHISFAWGEEGHKLINKKAIEILPDEMNFLKNWKLYIAEHASDADDRKKTDSSEWNKHFIDLDYYKEFNNAQMIEDKDRLIQIYGDSIVNKIGILPWATAETFRNLVKAFKEKNKDKILFYTADLGHYVADGHQPLHTVLNYDGQLTDQDGLHYRYEVTMIGRNLNKLRENDDSQNAEYISKPLDFIFHYLQNTNSVVPLLFDADNYAFEIANSRKSNEYYNLLWFRTEYFTKIQMQSAANDIASLIYTAWVEAG